jgi:hypothetical protein
MRGHETRGGLHPRPPCILSQPAPTPRGGRCGHSFRLRRLNRQQRPHERGAAAKWAAFHRKGRYPPRRGSSPPRGNRDRGESAPVRNKKPRTSLRQRRIFGTTSCKHAAAYRAARGRRGGAGANAGRTGSARQHERSGVEWRAKENRVETDGLSCFGGHPHEPPAS